MKIYNQENREIGESLVLKAYFGTKPGQGVKEFLAELRELTPEAKTELTLLCAKELNYAVIWP